VNGSGCPLRIEPKVMGVLVALADRTGEVNPGDDLIDQV